MSIRNMPTSIMPTDTADSVFTCSRYAMYRVSSSRADRSMLPHSARVGSNLMFTIFSACMYPNARGLAPVRVFEF